MTRFFRALTLTILFATHHKVACAPQADASCNDGSCSIPLDETSLIQRVMVPKVNQKIHEKAHADRTVRKHGHIANKTENTALIIGGTGVVGREIALALHNEGWQVTITHSRALKDYGWLEQGSWASMKKLEFQTPTPSKEDREVQDKPWTNKYAVEIQNNARQLLEDFKLLNEGDGRPPALVVNAAAKSEPFDCSAKPEASFLLNTIMPWAVFEVFGTSRFMHFSTNYVYNTQLNERITTHLPLTSGMYPVYPTLAEEDKRNQKARKAAYLAASLDNTNHGATREYARYSQYQAQKLLAEELLSQVASDKNRWAQLDVIRIPAIFNWPYMDAAGKLEKYNSITKQLATRFGADAMEANLKAVEDGDHEARGKLAAIRYPIWVPDLAASIIGMIGSEGGAEKEEGGEENPIGEETPIGIERPISPIGEERAIDEENPGGQAVLINGPYPLYKADWMNALDNPSGEETPIGEDDKMYKQPQLDGELLYKEYMPTYKRSQYAATPEAAEPLDELRRKGTIWMRHLILSRPPAAQYGDNFLPLSAVPGHVAQQQS